MTFLLSYIDFLWLVPALFAVPKGSRLQTVGYVLACLFLLRLQVELMREIGFPNGIIGWMESDILLRGQSVYSVFILLFIILSLFSKGVLKSVHLAASITFLIGGLCVSSFIMVL